MRVVFDTNVFVSALVFPGGAGERAVRRVIEGRDHLVVSRAIVKELLDVLARKFARNREELARVAVFLVSIAEVVEPRFSLALLPDEGDDRVLECAVAGTADVIVTGDKELLALRIHEGVRIVRVAEYLGAR